MPSAPLFHAALELLQAILTGTMPADAQMERYFRAHPKLGARDRGLVAETVYAVIRRRRTLSWFASGQLDMAAETAGLVAAALVQRQGLSARALRDAGYRGDAEALTGRVRTGAIQDLPPAVRLDLPDWLYARLQAQYGATETEHLAQALNEPATLDLRVNTLRASREEAAACLAGEGFPAEPTPYSPVGLRRRERAPLFRTRCFRDGQFEVQDEGSQLLSMLVEPRRREMVVDFCAGAGGKSLHLAALMANSGSLYAFDVSGKRLDRLKPRLARAGVSNVRSVVIANERDPRVRRLEGKIDRALVDAPCSGTGTLRRNPDIKWRDVDLAALATTQSALLAAAARLIKPGGRLVYATCSLLRDENEAVVEAFLSGNSQFHAVPAADILARRQIHLPDDVPAVHPASSREALRLLPHRHHTDGFFALVMERGN